MNEQACGDPYRPFQKLGEPTGNHYWQLCPKCNGNGSVLINWDGYGPFSTSCTCDLCNGKKVISSTTGLPPA